MVGVGEGEMPVGEDVVHREGDELTATPEDLPEQVASVERVGEMDREHHDGVESVTGFLEAEHWPHAGWELEVFIAGLEELTGELDRGPPPRYRPQAERVLYEHAGGVEFLLGRARRPVGDSGELHLHRPA